MIRFLIKGFLFFCLSTSTLSYSATITVLTRPVVQQDSSFWCHPAVTSSLLRGLKNLQVDFNYNPLRERDVAPVVVVLSSIEALKQAIQWKKSGKIKKLLAGPNLVIGPLDYGGIILSPYIDRYMVNSKWTRTAYLEDGPTMLRNIVIWPTGVDPSQWTPKAPISAKQNKALVYWKTESEGFCQEVEAILKRNGWEPIRIQYGNYDGATFKRYLDLCAFAVFISRSESQGIALAEAWSMDVPTLVWNPQEVTINNRKYSESSACPYLTPSTGMDWKYLEEFEGLLRTLPENLPSFQPRKWVLENMSDTASTAILLSIIEAI